MKITRRQQRFVDAYLATWSQVEAARTAGYALPESQAWRIIRRPAVIEAIKARMSEQAMAADELLLRLGQEGRVNIAMFFNFSAVPDENDQLKRTAEINWDMVEKYGFLLKTIRLSRNGWHIEVVDQLKAQELIGKHLKLFTEAVDLNLISAVKAYVGISPDDWDVSKPSEP